MAFGLLKGAGILEGSGGGETVRFLGFDRLVVRMEGTIGADLDCWRGCGLPVEVGAPLC